MPGILSSKPQPNGYLETCLMEGAQHWRLIVNDKVRSGFVPDLKSVLKRARLFLGPVQLDVWDCDAGKFTGELVANEMEKQ
jgi:hypothetical protein